VAKPIYNIFFVDEQSGWVAGAEGLLARTDDGGHTWKITGTPTTNFLTSVFFINKQTGWAVGHNSTILYTKDGGATWKQSSITDLKSSAVPLTSVSFPNEAHGWAVGGNGTESFSASESQPSNIVLSTSDGGQTWRLVQL
jgi:photosystem II stability/assembly factor-like uncharacterized protein